MALLPSNTPTTARIILHAAKNPIVISKGGLGSTAQALQGIVYQKADFDGLFTVPLNANAPLISEREGFQFTFNVSPVLATAFPEPTLLDPNLLYRKRAKAVQEFCLKTRDYDNANEIQAEETFFAINAFLGFIKPKDFFYSNYAIGLFDGILTQSPTSKKTSKSSQEYLSLLLNLSPLPTTIKVVLTYKNVTNQSITVLEITENINTYDVYDFDVSPRNLPIQSLNLENYQIQFLDQDNNPLSGKFTYILRQQIEQDFSTIVFLNTLGSYETFDFHGFSEQNLDNSSEFFTDTNFVKHNYYNELTQKIKLRTDPLMRFWKSYLVRELSSSQSIFWKINDTLHPIINISNSVKNEDEMEIEETLEIEFEIAQKDIIQ